MQELGISTCILTSARTFLLRSFGCKCTVYDGDDLHLNRCIYSFTGEVLFWFCTFWFCTPAPYHGAIAKFEANLKASGDDLFHCKRRWSLLLLFFCAEHFTKTWQSLREFCSSIKKLKDHLWPWNVFFPHLHYRVFLIMPWKTSWKVEKISNDSLELPYQRDLLQIARFCEVTWKNVTGTNQ